jgi:hypothetical protein
MCGAGHEHQTHITEERLASAAAAAAKPAAMASSTAQSRLNGEGFRRHGAMSSPARVLPASSDSPPMSPSYLDGAEADAVRSRSPSPVRVNPLLAAAHKKGFAGAVVFKAPVGSAPSSSALPRFSASSASTSASSSSSSSSSSAAAAAAAAAAATATAQFDWSEAQDAEGWGDYSQQRLAADEARLAELETLSQLEDEMLPDTGVCM